MGDRITLFAFHSRYEKLIALSQNYLLLLCHAFWRLESISEIKMIKMFCDFFALEKIHVSSENP